MGKKAVARQNEATRATIRVRDNKCEIVVGSKEIFFQSEVLRGREFRNFDFALLALLVASMSSGERFTLDYPVTRAAVDGFQRYARLLQIMLPGLFHAPQVDCSKVHEEEPSLEDRSAICMSGGIDSVYAALFRQGEWTHSLLIKGADYTLSDTTGLEDLRRRLAAITSELALQPAVMETNLREFMTSYKLQHAGLLASCLHCLGAVGFAHGAYAADYSRWHELIAYPCGSLAGLADTLTTTAFPVSYVGNEFGRSEKIKRIAAAVPKLFSQISVCWSDRTRGGNCGRCAKCMRTRLNLYCIADEALRNRIELSLFGDHVDPFQYLKTYEVPDKPRLVRAEIGWIDDIASALPDGELKNAVAATVTKLMNAYLRPGRRHDGLIPRLISRMKRR